MLSGGTLAGLYALGFALIDAYLLGGAVMKAGGGKPVPVGCPLLNH